MKKFYSKMGPGADREGGDSWWVLLAEDLVLHPVWSISVSTKMSNRNARTYSCSHTETGNIV